MKLENSADSRRHLGYADLLTPKAIAQKASMTTRFLKKLAEYEALHAEIAILQAEALGAGAKRGDEHH